MEYIVKTQKENNAVSEIIKGWGSDILVSRGKAHKAEELDGVLAIDNGKMALPVWLLAFTVKLAEPATVGMPEITPVEE